MLAALIPAWVVPVVLVVPVCPTAVVVCLLAAVVPVVLFFPVVVVLCPDLLNVGLLSLEYFHSLA